jgi:hypothetical protein
MLTPSKAEAGIYSNINLFGIETLRLMPPGRGGV